MRAHGHIHSGSDLGTDAHACWTFDRQQEFVDASLEYLTDGLRAGQRIVYVGSEPVAQQREQLEQLGGVAGMIDAGALLLFQLDDLYDVGRPVDTDAQLATYAAATDAALADGYTGLRVAAQVTNLVAEPETWDAHVRWEATADRFMSVRPMSAMCGYRRDAIPAQLLSDLAAVHPASNAPLETSPFHLFAETGDLVLSGEVDFASSEALDRLLGIACEATDFDAIDLRELDFTDHHGLEVLARHAKRLAAEGKSPPRNVPPAVERLCGLLELEL